MFAVVPADVLRKRCKAGKAAGIKSCRRICKHEHRQSNDGTHIKPRKNKDKNEVESKVMDNVSENVRRKLVFKLTKLRTREVADETKAL